MTTFLIFAGLVALLLVLFVASQARMRTAPGDASRPTLPAAAERQHVTYLSQITQALSDQDVDYLSLRGEPSLVNRVREERRAVIRHYLDAIQGDFERLIAFARVIALLSPEVSAAHEWERLRLMIRFRSRLFWIRLRLFTGIIPVRQLMRLTGMVASLGLRLDAAMSALGERAAFATVLSSTLNRNSGNLP